MFRGGDWRLAEEGALRGVTSSITRPRNDFGLLSIVSRRFEGLEDCARLRDEYEGGLGFSDSLANSSDSSLSLFLYSCLLLGEFLLAPDFSILGEAFRFGCIVFRATVLLLDWSLFLFRFELLVETAMTAAGK